MKQNELQRTFIAMLFAFVASTVALKTSEVLTVLTYDWTSLNPIFLLNRIQESNYLLLSGITHCLLAILVFSMSWVMWSKSQAAGHVEDIKSVFSVKFITLLLEVFLVVMYYSIANSIESDINAYKANNVISDYIASSSAKPEANQMVIIFIIFFIWDYIVDVAKSPREKNESLDRNVFLEHLQGLTVYCSISFLCALGAFIVSISHPLESSALRAATGDACLILLLLFFYRAKSLEFYLLKIFPKEQERKNTARTAPPTLKEKIDMLAIAFIFIILIHLGGL